MTDQRSMSLADLVAELGDDAELVFGDDVASAEQLQVTGVEHDSRKVTAGTLFCCLRGTVADGHHFAADALDRGATALIVEHPLGLPIPQIVVPAARPAMARAAAAFWGHPSRRLSVIGVTGTSGKTTVTNLLADVLRFGSKQTSVIGTLSGERTTPESTSLQQQLAEAADRGDEYVAIEVSSHALDQSRVAHTHFAAAVFTNLSREHLDYHTSMEDYFNAKAQLFTADYTPLAIVNLDDSRGRLLRDAAQIETTGFSIDDVTSLEFAAMSSSFCWRGRTVELPLGGAFNVSNALAAATTASALGMDDATIAQGLAEVHSVPGRFEPVVAGQDYAVVVDFAHKPDALERVLEAARRVVGAHRVIVVFGCGGDRDRSKRPEMGEIAARLADTVVVTSDNPRTEDPQTIVDEILAGISDPASTIVDLDRRSAIATALADANRGDLVLIAGKGDETTQTTGDVVIDFDDRLVAADIIRHLSGADS